MRSTPNVIRLLHSYLAIPSFWPLDCSRDWVISFPPNPFKPVALLFQQNSVDSTCWLLYSISRMKHSVTKKSTEIISDAPRAFLYVRVSTDRQSQEGHSLADQEKRLTGYAQSIGVPVAGVFIEAGVSGGKRLSLRPKGAQLMGTLRAGDHVIATKLDRMFRSASDALNVAEELREKGIHLHLLDIGGEVTGNGVAKLVFAILAAVSQMERERIGERVRSVKEHLRDAGYYTGGKLARGFRATRDGRIEADPQWERCFARMRELQQGGEPYRRIVEIVDEEFGIRMDYSTAYRILKGKRGIDAAKWDGMSEGSN